MQKLAPFLRKHIGLSILLGSLTACQVLNDLIFLFSKPQLFFPPSVCPWGGKLSLAFPFAVFSLFLWILSLGGCIQAVLKTRKALYVLLLSCMLLPILIRLGTYATGYIQITLSVPEPTFLRYPLGGEDALFSNVSRVREPDQVTSILLPVLPMLFFGLITLARRWEGLPLLPFLPQKSQSPGGAPPSSQ